MTICSSCNAPTGEQDMFCSKCGHPVSSEAAANLEKLRKQAEQREKMSRMDHLNTDYDVEDDPLPPNDDLDILTPGTLFSDRYKIETLLGQGGMGIVYKAHDTLIDRTIALKLIRPERVKGASAVQRLISEGALARDIRHRNVVAVYDVGSSNNQPFVSMEYLNGQSLRDWHGKKVASRTEIPLRVAARIMAEICDGLAVAHEAGIVHRDLKPDNIMLVGDPDENAAPLKILDFGLALATGPTTSSNSSGLGNRYYMAPEQITNPDAAGPEADSYSLSVMFYELLLGVVPQSHWQPPSHERGDIGTAIDSFIKQGLSNRAASRPHDAGDYRKQLLKAVNNPDGATRTRKTHKTGTRRDPETLTEQLRAEWLEQWMAQPAGLRWTAYIFGGFVILASIIESMAY